METTSNKIHSSIEHKQNTQASPLVEIRRTFAAPVERIWSAWSDPQMMKQWWGPESYTCPEAKIDFRVGGKCLLAMKSTDGKITWSTGTFEEIVPYQKIVCTDSFADENGKIISANQAGMPGNWPSDVTYITIEFESLGGNKTKMSITHEGIPREMHDDCVNGWTSSIDKMQRLVESH